MENRNPVKSIAWIFVLVFIPIIGFLCYILVGKKFRKRHVISKRSLQTKKKYEIADVSELPTHIMSPEQRSIASLASNNSDAVVYEKNSVKVYTDAGLLYEDIFAVIKQAKHHIHLEYYIFISDEIGRRMINALKEKAQEGVIVRVIIDDVGSWQLKKRDIKEMRASGILVMSFLEVGLPFINSHVNYRNHRKILVVDGKVGFTGGINIADRYIKGLKWGTWRDTHIKMEGSVVSGLQKSFFADWFFVKRELISDAVYFPNPEEPGNSLMQIVCSGPDMQWESIMQIYAMSFMQAKKRIYIETPYFLPPESLITALQVAALSGIDVRIILPKRSDAKITLISSYSYLDQMFKAGIKIYLYQPGFIHSKMTLIDDNISFIGSANMDFRSFDQNFELNTIIYDSEVGQEIKNIFELDLTNSVELDVNGWKKRPLKHRFKESLARLFSPLL